MNTLKKYFAGILLGATLIIGGLVAPQRAEAQAMLVYDPSTWWQALSSASSNWEVWLKEYGLDGIAWFAANALLETMLQDITTWVNSGFEGSPAFITNPEKLFTDVADIAAGKIIGTLVPADASGKSILCSPIDFQIRYTLHIYTYNRDNRKQFQCKLSDMVRNVENFYNGSLKDGGILALNVALHNNPYAQISDIQFKIIEEQNILNKRITDETNRAGGFFEKKKCYKKGETDGKGQVVETDEVTPGCTGPIETPGSVINASLNKALGVGQDRLAAADEIDELIGALLNQVVVQAIGATGGLVGLTQGGDAGNPTFFNGAGAAGIVTPNQTNTAEQRIAKNTDDAKQFRQYATQIKNSAQSAYSKAVGAVAACSTEPNATKAKDIFNEADGILKKTQGQLDGLEVYLNGLSTLRIRLTAEGDDYQKFLQIIKDLDALVSANSSYRLPEILNTYQDIIARMNALAKEAETLEIQCGVYRL